MELESRVEALEHLVAALLKKNPMTLNKQSVFEDAHASIMGSNGPGGPNKKTAAAEALRYIREQFSE